MLPSRDLLLPQRITLAEIPYFLRRHDTGRVVGMPMSFALYRNEHDLHTVFSTSISGIIGHRVRLIGGIRLNDLRSHVTTVKSSPLFHVIRYTSVPSIRMIGISIIIYHIIGCTMRMDDGYGTSAGRITVCLLYTSPSPRDCS